MQQETCPTSYEVGRVEKKRPSREQKQDTPSPNQDTWRQAAHDFITAKIAYNLATHQEKIGVASTEEAVTVMEMTEASEELLASPVFVTDQHFIEQGQRAIESEPVEGTVIAERMRFMTEQLEGEAPASRLDEFREILNEFSEFLKDKQVYTAGGLEGIVELVNDNFLSNHVFEQYTSKKFFANAEVQNYFQLLGVESGQIGDSDAAEYVTTLLKQVELKAEMDIFNPRERQVAARLFRLYKEQIIQTRFLLAQVNLAVEQIKAHNDFEKLAPEEEKMPLEIRTVLAEARGEDKQRVREAIDLLRKSRGEVCFRTVTQTSESAVAAAHHISVLTQHNFQTTWLPQFVAGGGRSRDLKLTVAPERKKIYEDDCKKRDVLETRRQTLRVERGQLNKERQALLTTDRVGEEKTGEALIQQLHLLEDKLSSTDSQLRQAEAELADWEETKIHPFEHLTDLPEEIARVLPHYKELVALASAHLTPKEEKALRFLNGRLSAINKDYIAAKLQFDVSSEQTAIAQKIMKAMMFIAPAAEVLEQLDLGMAAKLVAGSADDLGNEAAEIKALLGAGFTWQELTKRFKLLAVAFAVASGLSAGAETLLDAGMNTIAGVAFAESATLMSSVTAAQSVKMFKEKLELLLAEEKLTTADTLELDPRVKNVWKQIQSRKASEIPTKEEMLTGLQQVLDILVEQGKLSEQKRQTIMEDAAQIDLEQLRKLISAKASWAQWKKAFRQDFNNPVRKGLLIGILAAPFIGAAAGRAGGLHYGLVLAGVGTVETLAGGAVVMAAKVNFKRKWERGLRSRIGTAEKLRNI